MYIDWEERLKNLLEKYKSQDTVTDEDKDEFIKIYEIYNVETKKKLDNLLKKLTEEQIREAVEANPREAELYRQEGWTDEQYAMRIAEF